MLLNINSRNILKYTFSLIEIKRLLKIINYNKVLQEKINININYYKQISKVILKIDENGIGRIYNIYNNNLVFEGKYSNKKKNGQGKEYNMFCQLSFEGEYKNGLRNGYGKQYRFLPGRVLEFEGEYKNGLRNGKGKEYGDNNIMIFEGEYLNNKRWNGIYKFYISEIKSFNDYAKMFSEDTKKKISI